MNYQSDIEIYSISLDTTDVGVVQDLLNSNGSDYLRIYNKYSQTSTKEYIQNNNLYFITRVDLFKSINVGLLKYVFDDDKNYTCYSIFKNISNTNYESSIYINNIGYSYLLKLGEHLFDELNANKIIIPILQEDRAIEILDNSYFKLEGMERANYFKNGKYISTYIYSANKTDWIKYDRNNFNIKG